MRVDFASLGREDRATQVFVKVGATEPAVCNLEPDFIDTTWPESAC